MFLEMQPQQSLQIMKIFRKISFLFFSILVASFSSQAQNSITEACYEGLKVRQMPGTNNQLRAYLEDVVDSDTVFAIILPPANCPRCEGIINPIFSTLKSIRPNIPTILISAYPDSIAAQKYLNRYSFIADTTTFDTDSKYNSIFSFDTGYLHIPYLLKINTATGDLILGIRAEDNSPDFLKEFCRFDKPIEKKVFELSKEYHGLFVPADSSLVVKHQYTLSYPDSISLSETNYQPEFYKDKLFFNDKLKECIVYFKTTETDSTIIEYQADLKTNSSQNKAFVQIPDSLYYHHFVETNGARFIALSPKMLNDSTLAISYSLPKLWFVDKNYVGYMNQASLLFVDVDALDHTELIPIVKNDYEDFFYQHFSIFKYGDDIATACSRMTWPMSYEKDDYCNIPEKNPFADEFYSFTQPIIATFDKNTGQLKKRIGNLPNLSKYTKTGYYFMRLAIDTWEHETIISDGFSGELEVISADSSIVNSKYKAFEIPLECIPEPDESAYYSYDCVAPYVNVFNRNIVDVKLTKDNIYCLVRYGLHGEDNPETDVYSVIEINRECGCKTEKRFNLDNHSQKYCGLRRTVNGVEPYALFKDVNTWKVVTYDL